MSGIQDAVSGMTRGRCQVCGVEVDGRSYYCSEHKRAKPSKKQTPTTILVDSVEPIDKAPKTITGEHYWKVFGEAIVLGVNWVILKPLDQFDDAEALGEALMTPKEEVEAVAKPVLRLFAQTPISKRFGGQIIENADLVGALLGAWAIMDRVKTVQRIVRERTGQHETQSAQEVAVQGVPYSWVTVQAAS
jgi:hypothetical protein